MSFSEWRAKRAGAGSFKVEFLLQSAEEPVPLADASIDTVVVTWTLCSIANASKALQQMKRVLKATGRLIFLEHGRAPDPRVVAWQDRLTPVWKRVAGGCHLNRKVDELITRAGFRITELRTCYLPGPRPMTYTYQGFAQLLSLASKTPPKGFVCSVKLGWRVDKTTARTDLEVVNADCQLPISGFLSS